MDPVTLTHSSRPGPEDPASPQLRSESSMRSWPIAVAEAHFLRRLSPSDRPGWSGWRYLPGAGHGHRGCKNDLFYGFRTILCRGQAKIIERQRARRERAFVAEERHDEVLDALAVRPTTPLDLQGQEPGRAPTHRGGGPRVLADLPNPEIKRPVKTIKQWRRGMPGLLDPAGRSTAAPKEASASSESTAVLPAASSTGSTTD